ncbi:hypothetical protein A3K73_01545 [Candidatus Pacearchaeota archaeon RBG_13_36_9]|nr:MAG: hypothetical protein A3K73_01545 [Candidatus Pacearchaeota archaeon RBG_13_36_9]
MKMSGLKITIFIVGVLLVITVLYLILVLVQVPYTANVIYSEKEPYNTPVCHDEQVKWSRDKCEIYTNFGPQIFQDFFTKCVVYNNDDTGGIFEFNIVTRDTLGHETENKYSQDKYSLYIAPFSKGEFDIDIGAKCNSDGVCRELDYSLTELRVYPPTKQVCENIVKYKDVEKTKTETRYCSAWKKIAGMC